MVRTSDLLTQLAALPRYPLFATPVPYPHLLSDLRRRGCYSGTFSVRMAHQLAQHVKALCMKPADPRLRKPHAAADLFQGGFLKIVLLDQAPVVLRQLG